MSKKKFSPESIEEVELALVRDAEFYPEKAFRLELTDTDGNSLSVVLDGIMVGDIIADARDSGLPVEWAHFDGVPRKQNPDGSYGPLL